jgi:hypothetical protein
MGFSLCLLSYQGKGGERVSSVCVAMETEEDDNVQEPENEGDAAVKGEEKGELLGDEVKKGAQAKGDEAQCNEVKGGEGNNEPVDVSCGLSPHLRIVQSNNTEVIGMLNQCYRS